MNITFVASEANPFVKTGGLADVVYALGDEFANNKHNVNIIIPFYSKIKNSIFLNVDYLGSFDVHMSWRHVETKVCYVKYRNINYYFIENDRYFARKGLYGESDDGERFAYFTVAAIELIKKYDIKSDIIHLHDWQVGMFPCVVKEKKDPYFANTKFVCTIHNPAFQGLFNKDFIIDAYEVPPHVYNDGTIRLGDNASTLKAAIMYSDKVTTVSPTHRSELLTSEGSKGLDGALRLRELDFIGILNGIDYNEFNPSIDKSISATYSVEDFYNKKQKNKEALLKRFSLKDSGLPVFGLVSRLTWQKGISLVFPMIRAMVQRGCNFVILGSGEYELEQGFEQIRKEFPDNVGIFIGYNDDVAHLIYAGSDFFLMPSLFEPCGLSQMISERYGTLPIVRMTGGLCDSVICYNNENADVANGFGFAPNSVEEFVRTVTYAFDTYWNLPLRKKLITNAMNTDNSWKKSASIYLKVYKSAMGK